MYILAGMVSISKPTTSKIFDKISTYLVPKDGVPKDVAVEVGAPNPKPAGFCWAAPKRLPAGAAACWPKPNAVEVAGWAAPKPNEPAGLAAPNALVAAGWAAPKPNEPAAVVAGWAAPKPPPKPKNEF